MRVTASSLASDPNTKRRVDRLAGEIAIGVVREVGAISIALVGDVADDHEGLEIVVEAPRAAQVRDQVARIGGRVGGIGEVFADILSAEAEREVGVAPADARIRQPFRRRVDLVAVADVFGGGNNVAGEGIGLV